VIWNNLNPDFITNFPLVFRFEEQKYLKFKVYDANDDEATIRNSEFIGETECTLGEIVAAPGQQLIKTLKANNKGPSCGNIILRTEEISQVKDKVVFQIEAKDLEDVSGIFSSFNPFFYISRSMENGGNQRVYKSNYQRGKSPKWEKFEKSVQELCNGDYERPLLIEVYDHHSSGNHKLVGTAEFNLKEIFEGALKTVDLENTQKYGKKKKTCGKIFFKNVDMVKVYDFLEYIAGGCQISLMIAVDFTASNGNPQVPNSLHFLNPNGYNQYEAALYSVAEILLNYDSDKMVPMYGFGGKINGMVSHCFHMNFQPDNPSVPGLQGIMGSYRNSLIYTELAGPTLFSQVLQRAVIEAEQANVSQNNQQYFVLLILTDGDIHDMRETVDWIVRGSSAPLSIVIVGIGNDSFTKMVTLDADEVPLIDSKGRRMDRDIVQFVPFREVGNSPSALAREVLAEIPREIVNFFYSKRNILPNSRQQAQEYDFNRSYSIQESRPVFNAPVPGPQNGSQSARSTNATGSFSGTNSSQAPNQPPVSNQMYPGSFQPQMMSSQQPYASYSKTSTIPAYIPGNPQFRPQYPPQSYNGAPNVPGQQSYNGAPNMQPQQSYSGVPNMPPQQNPYAYVSPSAPPE